MPVCPKSRCLKVWHKMQQQQYSDASTLYHSSTITGQRYHSQDFTSLILTFIEHCAVIIMSETRLGVTA